MQKKGFCTIGIDIDLKKIQDFKLGKPSFFEPKLAEYLNESITKKMINFTDDFDSILKTDITFVTVGTPSSKNGHIELGYLKSAIKEILRVLKKKKTSHLLVIKSTIIPTTTSKHIFPKIKQNKNIHLVVNPEFLRESNAINDLMNPHLIVIGENDNKSGQRLVNYYKMFYNKLPEVIKTDFSSAELIKYANNAFLATKISFINSIANICQNIPNSDVKTIAYAIGKDPRIGSLFLNAGPGFGGSCLPKDLSALIKFSDNMNNTNSLLKEVKIINEKQPDNVINLMKKLKVFKKNKTISILGLSFKKDTDDIRYSVSIKIVNKLIKKGLKIRVHDPMAIDNFREIFGNKINYFTSIKKCLKDSDCCIILTDWDIYKKIGKKNFIKLMKTPKIIDAKRILKPKEFSEISFEALGLGN